MKGEMFIVRHGLHSRPPQHSNLLGLNPMLLGWQLLKFRWKLLPQLLR